MPNLDRRKFIRTGLGLAAGIGFSMPAYSYNRIVGANSKVNVVVAGVNGRGTPLAKTFAATPDCRLAYLCDVDREAIGRCNKELKKDGHATVRGEKDFRRTLEDAEVDAIVIATPDHWHAPMSIIALDAGKHVYVEKPCSHNPAEGEMLVEKQRQTGKLVQMGNQHRSSRTAQDVIKEIHGGLIGRAYYGKAWYANTRGSIGRGKVTPVPAWLDWELWQGPAPREEYRDNIVHYNWHWMRKWGTGEILNNGTHEIDLCRWALQVDYPEKVTSSGGRHHYNDDWEFYDTQVASYDFGDGKTISWEGRSCNGMPFWERGRGAMVYGTEGTVLLDRSGIVVYDLKGNVIREEKEAGKSVSMDVRGGGSLDANHAINFVDGIRNGAKLHSPIEDANTSVTVCHLGNIAQASGGGLELDPQTGKPKDRKARKMWDRKYAKGWKPQV